MGFDPIPNRIRLVEGASKAKRMDVLFTGLCGSEVRVEVCSLTSFVPWWINSTSSFCLPIGLWHATASSDEGMTDP